MRKFWCIAAVLLSGSCTQPETPESTAAKDRTNVVLISIDTLRADHLSCYGYSALRTANIDHLAHKGILFEQTIAPVPLTLPSHASLLTGSYPIYHGVRDNSGFVLPDDQITLAEVLQENGYRTGAFVGAFVLDRRFGLDQGFDYYYDNFEEATLEQVNLQIAERGAETVIAAAENWIRANTRPFFAWIHLFDPHAPYDAPSSFQQPGRHPYDAEVAYVDSVLGSFFEFLNGHGLFKDSLIVFTADHGEGLGEHGENTHGMFLYDTTLRVPLVFKLPKNRHAGLRIKSQVRLIDVVPSVLEVLKIGGSSTVQGVGLQRAWSGKEQPDLPAYGETLLPFLNYGWSDIYSIRTSTYKFIEAPRPELYQIGNDVQELQNLYGRGQSLGLQLREQLKQIRSKYSGEQAEHAQRKPDSETVERLRSLGYAAVSTTALAASHRLGLNSRLADPKDKIELFNLIWEAQSAAADGQYERSSEIIRRVLSRDDPIFMAHSIQALNLLQLGRPRDAMPHLRRAATLRPDDAGAPLYLGLAALKTGELNLAKQAFEKALALDPENDSARNNLGTIYVRQQEFQKAAAVFNEIVRRSPADVAAHVNLGVAYMMQKESTEAQAAFERALQINPKLPEVHNNLGLIYLNQGKLDPAIFHFNQALQLRPTYENARVNLEKAHQRKRSK